VPESSGQPDPPGPLAEAILRTILYADVFDYPLTLDELQRFLCRTRATRSEVEATLRNDSWLSSRVVWAPPLITATGRTDTFGWRRNRERTSAEMERKATKYARYLCALPFVRMVALTGSLAMSNVRDGNGDIDFLIVTAKGRLWLVRLGAVALVHLARLEGVTLCPNYILSTEALSLADQSLFTAHELAQMRPLCGHDCYRQMVTANGWAETYLPNGFCREDTAEVGVSPLLRAAKRLGEQLLRGRLGDALERREMARTIPRLRARAARSGTGAARFDSDCCKGHLADYGSRVRDAYHDRLRRYGLTADDERS